MAGYFFGGVFSTPVGQQIGKFVTGSNWNMVVINLTQRKPRTMLHQLVTYNYTWISVTPLMRRTMGEKTSDVHI